ncbi:type II toxin-antitoxin system mRNA interferase toxin, RelE/StbE family [Patescibacteria group bacterium]|nr:type II toxin-antitoxin system mRNA interferase toxin, RelE/StbE family [Patescibacteria group bacterium]
MAENKNPPSIDYSKRFLKQLRKSPLSIQEAFRERREIYLANPFHPTLHNHQLTGQLERYRSINITGDWRALFRMIETSDGTVIYFDAIGTHSQLYRI